ncbi:MAG: YggS family pyridoxal phosphate-dependent enzyme [Flavobacteriales bacterium]|nr:YggS family pyridoxal phosphate-dependent enzyme [Flavobacteriales bacterium]
MSVKEKLQEFKSNIPDSVTLVAVSKTKPAEMIQDAYQSGHLDYGENKAQEMQAKAKELPKDIRWHFIGHLQRNKVKYIAPHVHLIHSVDSLRLLREINKRAGNEERVIDVLLQVYIAKEESKYGLDEEEVIEIMESDDFKSFENVKVIGLMGMATNTDNMETVRREFKSLKTFFDKIKQQYDFSILSMGMTNDYEIAVEEGSTMLRVGSAIFGARS